MTDPNDLIPEEVAHQALLEISFNHILAQGNSSVGGGGTCLYRAPDGCTCAAAPFILEGMYTEEMESESFDALDSSSVDPLAAIHGDFVTNLQYAHDTAALLKETIRSPVTGHFMVRHTRRSKEEFLRKYIALLHTEMESYPHVTIPPVPQEIQDAIAE